jgi:hypothetical protein
MTVVTTSSTAEGGSFGLIRVIASRRRPGMISSSHDSRSPEPLVAGPPSVRERFIATVAALPGGRTLPADFTAGKVVYAILMENGRRLIPDTLFPFSQATLAHGHI